MFITSEQLNKRILTISEEIATKSSGKLKYEEFVACPCYGQIVLRFSLADDSFSISDIDQYENIMRACAGNEFLVDFMGNVYRSCGVDYGRIDELLSICSDRYGNEAIVPSPYADLLQEDAKELLDLCGLPTDYPVWEIQLEECIRLLLMGEEKKEMGSFRKGKTDIQVSSVNAGLCNGLMRATFHAKNSGVSLARVLLEVQKAK